MTAIRLTSKSNAATGALIVPSPAATICVNARAAFTAPAATAWAAFSAFFMICVWNLEICCFSRY